MKESEKGRELGFFDALMGGLGGAMGVEIFVLLNYAADAKIAGSAVALSLFLCGMVTMLTMLSYCELGAAIPEVGSEYTYTKAAFGGLTAFLAGWLRWVSSGFVAALAAIGFAIYVQGLIPWRVNIPLTATIIVVILTVLSIRGLRETGPVIVIAVFVTFVAFIASGLLYGLQPKPLVPSNLQGLPGVFEAMVYTIPMFLGAKAVVAGGAQIKDPGRNIPRAILLSALIITALNCGIAYVAVGVVPSESLVGLAESDTTLLISAAETIKLPFLPQGAGVMLLTVAGIIAALSSLSTAMTIQSSITLGLSRDGYLPKVLLSVHKRVGTPYVTIIINSVFIILFAATGVVSFLGYAVSFGSLLVFTLVNLSLMKLRRKRPYLKRPFMAPLYPLTPIAGIGVALTLLMLPVLLGGESAGNAFMLGFELIVLALITYHLKMVGYRRLRIAIGGINLGVGGLTALLVLLIKAGLISLDVSQMGGALLLYGLIFIGAVNALAGALNVTVKE